MSDFIPGMNPTLEKISQTLWESDRKKPEHRIEVNTLEILRWVPKEWEELTSDERFPYTQGAVYLLARFPVLRDVA